LRLKALRRDRVVDAPPAVMGRADDEWEGAAEDDGAVDCCWPIMPSASFGMNGAMGERSGLRMGTAAAVAEGAGDESAAVTVALFSSCRSIASGADTACAGDRGSMAIATAGVAAAAGASGVFVTAALICCCTKWS